MALHVRLLEADQAAEGAARRPGQPFGPIAPGLVYESVDAVLQAELAEREQARVH